MRRLLLTLTILATALGTSRAGKVVTDSLRSSILDRTVMFNVYLPDGFDASSNTRYPVIYLLHGLYGTHEDWPLHLLPVADELINSGEMRKAVVIMPDAGGRDPHKILNGYFNTPGRRYEDFFFYEFIPEVEQRYKCGSHKGQRAVMGLSMGGGGSTVYSQRHPEVFSSCYAMSAWLDNESNDSHGESDPDDYMAVTEQSVCDHSALRFMENADEATVKKLRTVKWFFDCGDDDFLFEQTVYMHKLMRTKGIKDELRIRDGVHNWEYWHTALRIALPFASRNFYD